MSRILKAVKGIVLCGHRDLVRKLDSVFEAMKKQKCLDWKVSQVKKLYASGENDPSYEKSSHPLTVLFETETLITQSNEFMKTFPRISCISVVQHRCTKCFPQKTMFH